MCTCFAKHCEVHIFTEAKTILKLKYKYITTESVYKNITVIHY